MDAVSGNRHSRCPQPGNAQHERRRAWHVFTHLLTTSLKQIIDMQERLYIINVDCKRRRNEDEKSIFGAIFWYIFLAIHP